MPESGLLDSSVIAAVSAETDAADPPWSIDEAVVQQITFEVRVPQARRHLPDLVTRSAPTYAKIAVIDRADSPVGPYREALLMLGCRVDMLPAQYVVAAVVTTEAASDATAAHWHYQPDIGRIDFERLSDEARSTIHVNEGFSVSLRSALTDAAPANIVRYDPLLVVQPSGDGPVPIEIPTEHEVREAWMDRASTLSYTGGERSSPWLQLRSHHPITAFVAVEGHITAAAAPVVPPQMG